MRLTVYENASDFLAANLARLEQDEVVNSLMIGIAQRLVNFPDRITSQPYLSAVEDDAGDLIMAATMTPPFNLITYAPRPEYDAAIELIAQDLLTRSVYPGGVMGTPDVASDFADYWKITSGRNYRLNTNERIYKLTEVVPPANVSGQMRLATEADLDLLATWAYRFSLDTNQHGSPDSARRDASFRISDRSLYVWEVDGATVNMAARNRPTKHGITINYVYTPDELRGHGYASALVAALSQLCLDDGYQFCTLYTDLANPTSNSIYQKIGYRPVCDIDEYKFENTD